MSYLNKMYGRSPTPPGPEKNPNRVSGGLRAQGVDSYKIMAEDGTTKEIPTQTYVRSLEDQLRKQRASITVLERKLTRQDNAINNLQTMIQNLKR